jgi:thiosulfate reductase cytochrome b subunit
MTELVADATLDPPRAETGAKTPDGKTGAKAEQLHPLSRRIMHWLNAVAIFIMIGSGWRIYNEHTELPIDFGFPLYVTLGGNFLQAWARDNDYGEANALLWHFGAMWLLVFNYLAYMVVGFATGHFQRDFLPIRPRELLHDLFDALRGHLSHDLGHYNAVQKLFYCGVLAIVLLTILSGLAIWKPVQFSPLAWACGGFDNARVVHCLGMLGIVGFLIVHLALVILVPKTLVAMVLGRIPSWERKT